MLVHNRVGHKAQADVEFCGFLFGQAGGFALYQHVARQGRRARAGAANAAAPQVEGHVQRAKGLRLPQLVHQAALVAAGHEDAVGLEQGVHRHQVAGVLGGAQVQVHTTGRPQFTKGAFIGLPAFVRHTAGRGDHRHHGLGGAAQVDETLQHLHVAAPVFGPADGHQVAGGAGRAVGTGSGGGQPQRCCGRQEQS